MLLCGRCGRNNPPDANFCNGCGASIATPAATAEGKQEVRKTVTTLFCDVVDSTALGEHLDAERLRQTLARYFTTMQRVIEAHGGTVEKFIGDAVMAVFGLPVVHEDDALRAVRAALGMLASLEELNAHLLSDLDTSLQIRIGIDTGEVVTGTEERLATGSPVNMAARLEQAAQPGEVLIGQRTSDLVNSAVDVVPLDPLTVKGRAEPVRAYRVSGLRSSDDRRGRLDTPMIGRRPELQKLADAVRAAMSARSCEMFTVMGGAGIGKTRLTQALLESLDGPVVLRGRCLPYGEGITYWPLVEIITTLPSPLGDLEMDPSARSIAQQLVAGGGTASKDEIGWSFRQLLQACARDRGVVVVFDDIHWGEDVFLDLVETTALLSQRAPIFLLCLTRPELMDRRPGWVLDIRLEQLPSEDAEQLLSQRLGVTDISAEARKQILESAAGNPLFVEEMTAVVRASGGEPVSVPATIQALLAARIDQLPEHERHVLSTAAVEGEVFHRGALQALLPGETNLMTSVASLVRKDLVVTHPARFTGEDGFRFRHLLIRDAAYESASKALRGQMHERLAGWLQSRLPVQGLEAEAICGYHLEQAHNHRVALGRYDEHTRDLAQRAGVCLAAAGRRALGRGDLPAADALLGRAVALISPDDAAHPLVLMRYAKALRMRHDYGRAHDVLDRTLAAAEHMGERAIVMRAHVEQARIQHDVETQTADHPFLRRAAEAAIEFLEPIGDDEGLAEAWSALAQVHNLVLRCGAMADALEKAVEHGARAGDDAQALEDEMWMTLAWVIGPVPAVRMKERARVMATTGTSTPRREVARLDLAGFAEALTGRFDAARKTFDRAGALLDELGVVSERHTHTQLYCFMELIAGKLDVALGQAVWAFESHERLGASSFASTDAGNAALALAGLARHPEAEHYAGLCRSLAASTDVISQMQWRRALAEVKRDRGELAEGLTLALEAAALMEPTDSINQQADTLVDVARLQAAAERISDAEASLTRALALYEQKGNVYSAAAVRRLLAGPAA